jgi:hypothetical protein
VRDVGLFAFLCALLIAGAARPLAAGDRYALVVTGASGDSAFADRYDGWRTRLAAVLADRLAFGRDRVFALGDVPGPRVQVASRDNVRATLAMLASKMRRNDLLLVVLIGHGSFDGVTAKFNLVGPDLDAGEWAALLKPIPGRLIVVDTTSASFPFLQVLAAKGRVVVSATDSQAARYDTVFPEQFIRALEAATISGGAGRLSIWDVVSTAAAGVRRHYESKGLLPVEHAVIDDAGDGMGKDPEQPGLDTSIAQAVYLTADPDGRGMDPATRELLARRDELLAEIEKLKAKKTSMDAAAYQSQLEQLLVDLAKVSRQLRARQGTADQ